MMFKYGEKMKVPAIIRRFVPFAADNDIAEIRENPNRILLVKQSERLGNIVLLNSAVSAVRNEFPDCQIDLLLPAKFATLMEDDSRVNDVIQVHKKDYISRPWNLLRLISGLRARSYDLTIDCSDVNSHSSTGIAYSLLSGARVTAGWSIATGRFFDIEVPKYSEPTHASDMYLKLLSGVFAARLSGSPYFDFLSESTSGGVTVVGINCGGRGEKRWPLENFIELGALLSGKGVKVEYLLGPDENGIRAEFEASIKSSGNLLPLMSIKELKSKIRGYSLFISSDTGPMHLAWALKVPVIAIFLSSELEKFKPLSPGSVVLNGEEGVMPREVFDKAMIFINAKRILA